VDGSLHYYHLDIVGFCPRAWLGVRFGSQSHQRLTTGHIQYIYIYIYMYICTGNNYCMYLSRYISCTYILHQSLPPVHPSKMSPPLSLDTFTLNTSCTEYSCFRFSFCFLLLLFPPTSSLSYPPIISTLCRGSRTDRHGMDHPGGTPKAFIDRRSSL
jgi:hypothetical protein